LFSFLQPPYVQKRGFTDSALWLFAAAANSLPPDAGPKEKIVRVNKGANILSVLHKWSVNIKVPP